LRALSLDLLLWTALIPFPTTVVAEYLGEGGEPAETAVALYDGVSKVKGVRPAACQLGLFPDSHHSRNACQVAYVMTPFSGRPLYESHSQSSHPTTRSARRGLG
jgi:hypothetical protein